jgi:metal-responsive CopG/Arc/MetJ family transcriptional regulator
MKSNIKPEPLVFRGIRFTDTEYEKLQRIAAEESTNVSEVIRYACRQLLREYTKQQPEEN